MEGLVTRSVLVLLALTAVGFLMLAVGSLWRYLKESGPETGYNKQGDHGDTLVIDRRTIEDHRLNRAPDGACGAPSLQAVGVNVVLHQPADRRGFNLLPGHLAIIYGNFSSDDPREIPFLWPSDEPATPRFAFSRSARPHVGHIQLNHYTVTQTEQAELRYYKGQHVLTNCTEEDEMDLYPVRVNGTPLALGERVTLDAGDIISIGIFRLKLVP